jgi:hypothetical protein
LAPHLSGNRSIGRHKKCPSHGVPWGLGCGDVVH